MNSIYANARAKVQEKTLLGKERINRMIDSLDANEAIKILSEVNFGGNILLDSCVEYEKLISAETENLFSFIRECCPSEKLKKFFLLQNDYHNAKAIVISKFNNNDVGEILVSDGIYTKQYLKEKIFSDDYSELTNGLREALKFADFNFVSNSATGANLGAEFTKRLFDDLFELTKGEEVLTKIIKCKADFTNISIALRTDSFISAKEYFVNHGEIDDSSLKVFFESSPERIKDNFKLSFYYDYICLSLDNKKEGKALGDYEKAVDSFAVKLLEKSRYSQEGNLPYIRYFYYKTADISNVRIILSGLLSGMKNIKERLRAFYE